MASATLIKRFAKRDRRIGSGVEEGILYLRFELAAIRSKAICNMPASTLTRSTIAAHDALGGAPSDGANRQRSSAGS